MNGTHLSTAAIALQFFRHPLQHLQFHLHSLHLPRREKDFLFADDVSDSLSRGIRTGEEVRLSVATSTASLVK